jgi:hypothetical protein
MILNCNLCNDMTLQKHDTNPKANSDICITITTTGTVLVVEYSSALYPRFSANFSSCFLLLHPAWVDDLANLFALPARKHHSFAAFLVICIYGAVSGTCLRRGHHPLRIFPFPFSYHQIEKEREGPPSLKKPSCT